MPCPTNHQADKQKKGRLQERQLSIGSDAGCQVPGHDVGNEISTSTSTPGRFMAVIV